jgi:hypothetical protein
LTDILRKYLENQFRILAMEFTSAEIMENLKEKTGVGVDALETLGKVLTMADLVKFAKYTPLPEDHEQSMENAVDFVNKTVTTNQTVATPEIALP